MAHPRVSIHSRRWSSVGDDISDKTSRESPKKRDRFLKAVRRLSSPPKTDSQPSLAGSISPRLTGTPAKITPTDLWNRAITSLPPSLAASLPALSLGQNHVLSHLTASAEAAHALSSGSEWTVTFRGRTYGIYHTAGRIVGWIEQFRKLGDVLMQFDPKHAALPWVAIRFLLQISLSERDAAAAVIVGIEKITSLLPRCAVYETLYLVGQNRCGIEKALTELYIEILQFLLHSHAHFKSSVVARTFRGIFTTSTAVDLVDSIEAREAALQKEVNLADSQLQHQAQAILLAIEIPITRIDETVSAVYVDLQATRRAEIVRWLSIIPYPQHHENALYGILENTGLWLLERSEFQCWEDSTESTILWLHGIPGAGKTKLTAMVLQRALAQQEDNAVAYFYCSRNEPTRQNPELILRTLIQQLSVHASNTQLPECIVTKYKERNKDGIFSGPPGFHESLDLLVELLDLHATTTIVIDALDEISSKFKRHEFLHALKHIIAASKSLVKLLVSSRDDIDIMLALDDLPNLYINADDNKEDIDRFIKQEVERAICDGRLLRGQVQDDLKERIISTLISKAAGMFQWVALQIDYMCEMNFAFEVEKNLGSLPETLEGAYAQIYATISGGRSFVVAKLGLMWLVCSRQLLDSVTWTAAVSQSASTELRKAIELDLPSLLRVCHNLVVCDRQQDVMRFSHLSVQEYLERKEFSATEAHLVAAQCALSMLNQREIWGIADGATSNFDEWHPFTIYCLAYWASHAQACNSKLGQNNTYKQLLNRFMGTEAVPGSGYTRWLELATQYRNLKSQGTIPFLAWTVDRVTANPLNPVLLAAYFGFSQSFYWVTGSFDVNACNSKDETLLFLASSCRNNVAAVEVVKILLENNVDVRSPLHRARNNNPLLAGIRSNNTQLVDLLLSHGAELAAYEDILEATAGEGSTEMVQHILSTHPELEITAEVLAAAAAANSLDVMALLLSRYHDTIPESVWMQAAAAASKDCEMLKLLLSYSRGMVVSENILIDAARNTNPLEAFTFFLDYDVNAKISEPVLMGAAFNNTALQVLPMLFSRNPSAVVTPSILAAAAANDTGIPTLQWLMAHPTCPTITSQVLQAAVSKTKSTETLEFLLPYCRPSDAVYMAAAKNPQGYSHMRMLLAGDYLDIRGQYVLIEAARDNWEDKETEVLKMLENNCFSARARGGSNGKECFTDKESRTRTDPRTVDYSRILVESMDFDRPEIFHEEVLEENAMRTHGHRRLRVKSSPAEGKFKLAPQSSGTPIPALPQFVPDSPTLGPSAVRSWNFPPPTRPLPPLPSVLALPESPTLGPCELSEPN